MVMPQELCFKKVENAHVRKGNCAFHKNKRDSSETFFLLVSCVVESAYDILSSNEFILNVKKHTVFEKKTEYVENSII